MQIVTPATLEINISYSMLPTPRETETKEKTRDENQALYSTRGQLPAGRTKRGIISPVAGR
jgi:hypothetical protein